MSNVIQRGRHRAPGRPSTPLDALAASLSSQNVGRGAVVAVASTGLVLGGATAASATVTDTIREPSVKATAISADELDRAGTTATVTVAAEADLGLAAATVSAEAPPPPPPVVRTVTAASRTRTTASSSSSSSAATVQAPPIDGSLASSIIAEAYKYIGVPYVSGGASPSGFDCSGFVQYVYAQFGISLPRTSGAQANAGYRVSAAEAQPGDLIWAPGHIGIYLGNGQHIAARNYSTPLSVGPVYMSNPVYIRVI